MSAMLTFRVLHWWLSILTVFELTFPIRSTQHKKKCYTVGNRDVCFFLPELNLTWVRPQKALETCRSSNGTLPMLLDEGIQGVFEEYMISVKLENLDDLWLAGREVRRREWMWANGVPFKQPAYFSQVNNEYKSHLVQGVLTDDLVYRKEYLGNRNNYVCQFFAAACHSKDTIPLKKGYLLLNDGEALDFYDARNKCVDRGGDLAIIDSTDDLNAYREVFRRFRNSAKLWIGLRRQWWRWGESESSDEVKYANWRSDNGFQPDLECMVVELRDYQWKQLNCSAYKRFICQIGPIYVGDTFSPKSPIKSEVNVAVLVPAISIPVITILLVVVIVAVIVRRRKSRPRQPRIVATQTDPSYLNLQQRIDEEGYLNRNQQYTPLKHPTTKPLLPPTDRVVKSQQMELNHDGHYDEIADMRIPSYLEILH